MAENLQIEFVDGDVLSFEEPPSETSMWWHGTTQYDPGVYVVRTSHDNPRTIEMFPLTSIRRLCVTSGVVAHA